MTGFERLVDVEGLAPGEEERLRRVHDLLVAAGPPPELPPGLERPHAARRGVLVPLARRRLAAALVLAAALAAAVFGGGYAVGQRGGGFTTWRGPVPMHGVPGATASLRIGPADAAGNWPVLLRVRGLPRLPRGGYYALVLAHGAERGPTCGTFVVSAGTTEVEMSAPPGLRYWTGWVVVPHLPGRAQEAPVLST